MDWPKNDASVNDDGAIPCPALSELSSKLAKDLTLMRLTEHDHMVDTFPSERAIGAITLPNETLA